MSKDSYRVLIVDDNKDHQILMEEVLKRFMKDVNIVFLSTGEECILELLKEDYSLIVIDYNLSDMNGLEVLKEIKSKEYPCPVIMVTAFGDENVAVEAMKLGACDYIVKSGDYLKRLPTVVHRVVQETMLKKEKKEVENKLKESELRYKSLLDNMIDVVFTADKQLNILSINLACQRVFEK